jgi:hypothetical protein
MLACLKFDTLNPKHLIFLELVCPLTFQVKGLLPYHVRIKTNLNKHFNGTLFEVCFNIENLVLVNLVHSWIKLNYEVENTEKSIFD